MTCYFFCNLYLFGPLIYDFYLDNMLLDIPGRLIILTLGSALEINFLCVVVLCWRNACVVSLAPDEYLLYIW
nr:hypothetical protein Iba_chr13fCG5410 [Ipomoea batatas]